jgi:hypothetical protein
MIENVGEVMVPSRSSDGEVELEVRGYGLAAMVETVPERIQGSPHIGEVLISTPDGRQCRGLCFKTDAQFKHGNDIAECGYISGTDAEIPLGHTAQNKRSDSMPFDDKSGGL